MEPETPAVNDLIERWKEAAEANDVTPGDTYAVRAAVFRLCAQELEAALTAARAPHDEMARELARQAFVEVEPGSIFTLTQEGLAKRIAAAMASVERTPWQRCPVTGEAHEWQCWFDGGPPGCTNPNHLLGPGPVCKDCQILRSAVEPAPVPPPERASGKE